MGLIVSLDLGSEKTVMAVAEVDQQNRLVLNGLKTVKTEGLVNGCVSDWGLFKSLISALFTSIGNAEVDECNIMLNGKALLTREFKISVDFHKNVLENDMLRLIQAAQNHAGDKGDFVVDVLPIMYSVDRKQTRNPLNAQGSTLSMLYNAYLADSRYIENLRRCFETFGINDINFYAPANVYHELWADTRKGSFAVVDLGAEHIGILLFNDGLLESDITLPLGSSTIESDIMTAFQLEDIAAVKTLKQNEGTALRSKVKADKVIVNTPRAKSFERRDFARVIQMRMEELLEGVIYQLQQKRFDRADAPVILTGGGSLLKDANELFAQLSGYDVQPPSTDKIEGFESTLQKSLYMMAIGLLLCDKPEEPKEKNDSWTKKLLTNLFN